ncbi:SMP-30/gluconolactonase/LRE family protein [Acetobacter conturbans]|uniref:SMP-30/gluconolactonase/LRE family protein n=1 Tax=Acetobacter conturbans TaxID=1737472 RepID=A0ABX0K4K6_9PROT|nr:SMP-30/gluconolactonase/LRE family protein [Acetobacter conturbans]NHN89135.1 SMP-30/gluconolactonase/LRE family protein [Acetobacter conturbans]
MPSPTGRRAFLAGACGVLIAPHAHATSAPSTPPDVTSTPPRSWSGKAPTGYLPDPDVIALDPSFRDLTFPGTTIQRVLSGGGWLEGPTWLGEARILLLSDTIRSTQYRLVPPEGAGEGSLSVFRQESFHSNGNTLDTEGRIITCEHDMRRVIRWEHDGSCRVIADAFNGKPLNSPNDVIVNPQDGSIWFTDPPYGDTLIEGHPDAPGNGANPTGKLHWTLGTEVPIQFAGHERQPVHIFRVDSTTGVIEAILSPEDVPTPNGLCFSPDQKTFYATGSTPVSANEKTQSQHVIYAFDMVENRPKNRRIFCTMTLDGHNLSPDGIRADVFGNLWCGASGPFGLAGVFCYNPAGKLIGRIRLPLGCSNLTFGGPKRNELYMCCGPQIFRLLLETQGAGLS